MSAITLIATVPITCRKFACLAKPFAPILVLARLAVQQEPVGGNSMNPNKALWEKGDFTRIAASMRDSGEALVKARGISHGLEVLDLGCGDGTTALPAARLGANVLGVDIARNLVEAGNARAQSLGLDQPAVPGRRRDGSDRARTTRRFDLVVSIFGAMFAPKPVQRGQGDGPGDAARRSDRHGELDPKRSHAGRTDPEDQFRLLAAATGGFHQPDDLGDGG